MADAMLNGASLAYAESFLPEDDIDPQRPRTRPPNWAARRSGPAGGATLRVLAAATGARRVVEVGTGAGVSGLYLLGGMAADGVLVTIDVEGENQRAAREAFTEAGHRAVPLPADQRLGRRRAAAAARRRLRPGRSSTPTRRAYTVYYEQALRLLRPGGVVAFDNALWHDRVADPSQRDPETSCCATSAGRCATTTGWLRCCCRGRRPAGGREALRSAAALPVRA